MNEDEYKSRTEEPDRISCKLKLPNQEPTDAECYINEGQLVVTGKPPIVVLLHRIKAHNPGGYTSNHLEIVYSDDLDKNRKFSLEMDNAQYFDLTLSRAIDSAKSNWLESLPVGKRYAGFWRRFVAYIIDGVILNIIYWVIFIIVGLILSSTQSTDIGLFLGLTGGLYLLLFIISLLYYIGLWAWQGATPGKMAMGVKIVKADGSPIGLSRAILRYIGYIISAVIIYIGYLMIAWDSKKQGLHDKMAGTIVVKVR
jgi:uncharacterized RDD family membrane protein YckC